MSKATNKKNSKSAATPKIKSKPKLKAVKTAPKENSIVGTIVQFVGYEDARTDGIFEKGQQIFIVDSEIETDGTVLFSCIANDDLQEYNEDAESVAGEQLVAEEFTTVKKTKAAKKSTAVVKAVLPPAKVVNIGDLAKMLKKATPMALAHKLVETINESYFYLGGVLAHMELDGTYKEYNEDWDAFCEEEFGFKGRKGHYLKDIYKVFSQLKNFDIKQLPGIGWAKAAELSRYITDDNQDDLMSLAQERNVVNLKATLKTDYTTEGVTSSGRQASRDNGRAKRTTYDFKLYEDQAEGVNYVLAEASKQLGTEDMNQIFEQIVMAWGQENLAPTKVKKIEQVKARAAKAAQKATA